MGLDMYLSVRKYVSRYDWDSSSLGDLVENPNYKIIKGLLAPNLDAEGSAGGINVELPAGYWRKANAIHKFFVDLDNGVDECQQIRVPIEALVVLRDKCQTVIDNPELAEQMLPTQGGFFFGSTDYDEWYIKDLEHTIEIVDKVLDENNIGYGVDVIYQASW